MRRWFIILALLFSLSIVRPIQAQNDLSIQTLVVEIWPEYDKPSALVIYRITLAPEVKLPAEMVLRVPKSAGAPNAIAEQTATGLFNINFTQAGEDGDMLLYRFTTTLPQLQMEYYDPIQKKDGSARSYSFRWTGDYPVQNLTINVQQPRTATNMRLQPDTGTSAPANDGLVYFTVPVGSVAAGNSFKLDLTYDKSDDQLTQPSTFESVTPVAPIGQATAGRFTINEVIPWLLGGLGVLLIAVGIIWYVRTGRQPSSPAQERHKRRAPAAAAAQPADTGSADAIFCHQCGKRASSSDVFCRACGTKLRKP